MSPRKISPSTFIKREQQLISIAQELMGEDSLNTLTIDKLVAAAPFSKGTIYKHFSCKEDLIIAMCNTSLVAMKQMFIKALSYNGSSREKLTAVSVAYLIWAKLHPSQLFAILSAHSPTVSICCSSERNEEHHQLEGGIMALFNDEISRAIEIGDLILPPNTAYEQITFALWSATWGAMALIMSRGNSIKLQPMILERETLTNGRLVLDGLGWKPLSSEVDYNKITENISTTMFAPELEILNQMGTPLILS
ncbi:MAG: TetR/AcrR family transcriptional regulator [bacterium]